MLTMLHRATLSVCARSAGRFHAFFVLFADPVVKFLTAPFLLSVTAGTSVASCGSLASFLRLLLCFLYLARRPFLTAWTQKLTTTTLKHILT